MTVTAHFITAGWEMKSPVLQTHSVYESHAGTNLEKVLTGAAAAANSEFCDPLHTYVLVHPCGQLYYSFSRRVSQSTWQSTVPPRLSAAGG